MKLTVEKFIEEANIVHNDFYDYSKVVYKNLNTKVTIICPVHGEFEQTPDNHLMGHRCSHCSRKNKLFCGEPKMKRITSPKVTNQEMYIQKARLVHFDAYDYSLIEYVNSDSILKIICKRHGMFEQKAKNHLNGNGCQKCSELKKRFWINAGRKV